MWDVLDGGCVRGFRQGDQSGDCAVDLGKFVRSWLGAKPIGQERRIQDMLSRRNQQVLETPVRCGLWTNGEFILKSIFIYSLGCFQLEYCSNHFNTTRSISVSWSHCVLLIILIPTLRLISRITSSRRPPQPTPLTKGITFFSVLSLRLHQGAHICIIIICWQFVSPLDCELLEKRGHSMFTQVFSYPIPHLTHSACSEVVNGMFELKKKQHSHFLK